MAAARWCCQLFACIVLGFHTGQLDESAAGAGAILTGNHGDVLIDIEIAGSRCSSGFTGSSLTGDGLAGSSGGCRAGTQAARLRARAAATATETLRFNINFFSLNCICYSISHIRSGVRVFLFVLPECVFIVRAVFPVSTIVQYNPGKALVMETSLCKVCVKLPKINTPNFYNVPILAVFLR